MRCKRSDAGLENVLALSRHGRTARTAQSSSIDYASSQSQLGNPGKELWGFGSFLSLRSHSSTLFLVDRCQNRAARTAAQLDDYHLQSMALHADAFHPHFSANVGVTCP